MASKRILNGIAWTLLFAASILAAGGLAVVENHRPVVVLVLLLASASIPLFWFGGYHRQRCKENKNLWQMILAYKYRITAKNLTSREWGASVERG